MSLDKDNLALRAIVATHGFSAVLNEIVSIASEQAHHAKKDGDDEGADDLSEIADLLERCIKEMPEDY